ncbi:MAG: CocE/NonD family hydrolase [Candidatus Sericytochromatia bacterium]|nr:CocE/NonD family hydrolase [Candidatus Sericytochromatia bacterium]
MHGQGQANTVGGDGQRRTEAPTGDDPPDRYTYDPRHPVPSLGGAMLRPDAGVARQTAVEARADVPVYSTPSLMQPMAETGPVSLTLHVATSAPATDFTAKPVDVHPDGTAYNLSKGILRRSYGPGGLPFTVSLWPTSNLVRAGHRLRLELSSRNYPRLDRHPNTVRSPERKTRPIMAGQVNHHDQAWPSPLLLPIIPR